MITKFIEGTNQQYSIREDGVVIRHYNNTKVFDKPKETQLCLSKEGNLYYPNRNRTKEQQLKWSKDYYHRKYPTREKRKKLNLSAKDYMTYARKILTKSCVASMLNISVKELTDELYNHHRNLVLFKRKVAKENNISIHSFNK